MTCPRCSQKLPPGRPVRCPKCGQPLYAPANQASRITRVDPILTLAPPPEQAAPPLPLDNDQAWPDLNVPVVDDRGPDLRQSSLLLSPPTWLPMPLPRRWFRQPVAIGVAAALILVLISGGALLLVNSLGNHSAPRTLSGSQSQSGTSGTSATTTGASSTAPATGVATSATTGLPTATRAASSPTQQSTAIPTSAPQLVTILSDPLTSNARGWPVQNGCSFAGGGYTVSAGARCQAPVTEPDTVNISVQMASTSASFSGAGIGFRIPSAGDDQYSFLISSPGTCTAADEVTDMTLFNNTSCSAVAQGATAVNTLTINQSGAHMDFYVNGTLVGSANDGTLSTGGIALEVSKGGSSMVFTNFVLTTLQ